MNKISVSNHEFDDKIVQYIRLKDIDSALEIYDSYFNTYRNLSLGSTYIRSLKNSLICTIYYIGKTLCPKYCEKPRDISRSYIDKIEAESSIETIVQTGRSSIVEFSNFISFSSLSCRNSIIVEAIKYIEENIDEDINLDILSKRVHLSKSYLSSMFIKHTGMKFTNLLKTIRIDRSKELLKSTEYSLGYISDLCGFKSQNYFSTVFKELEEMTPMDYRCRHLG